jgi:hypothetical protein
MSQCDSKLVGDEREGKGGEVEARVCGQVCCVVLCCGVSLVQCRGSEGGGTVE